MSVKIEILDYKYEEILLEQMNTDASFNDPSSWTIDPAGRWVVAGGSADKQAGTGAGYISHPMTFVEGDQYRILYKISGLTTSGSLVLANHLAGNANGFSTNTNGTFSYDWVQGANNTDKLRLYGSSTFNGKVKYALVYPLSNIDWDNSIVGELDVTDHSDFPVAMTFQISDFKDLTSTTGDYSKTFKIPATKNNNNLLKHLYIPNISNKNKVTEKKSCRILFNNLYSLVGLLQVDGVGGYGETPSYYNCVFFGSNLIWADRLQDSYMNTIDWGGYGDGLTYNKDSITATWQHEDCNNASNSPIVYPITSYGDYNPLGEERTIQLLDTAYEVGVGGLGQAYYGFFNSGMSYGTPPPVSDWRPSLFVKTTLDKIFEGIGYRLNSEFMETDMFKKLVWLLPNFRYNNPDDRTEALSVEADLVNFGYLEASPAGYPFTVIENGVQMMLPSSPITQDNSAQFYTGDEQQIFYLETITSNPSSYNLDITLNNDSYVDVANNLINIGEYGNYNVSLKGLNSKLALGFKGGSDLKNITALNTRIVIEVRTVGQVGWAEIASGDNELFPLNGSGGTGVNSVTTSDSEYVSLGDISFVRYFNKGDSIRLRVGQYLYSSGSSGQPFFSYVFFNADSTAQLKIEVATDSVEYGQTYNLKDVISPDYKQIDFIKGVAHAFNLQMTTDESTKTINIEPFDSFYKPYADAIDWTYKLDRSNETNDNWIENDLKRTLIFKYKSDNADAEVKLRGETIFHDIEDEYPYREILPNTFNKGESKFENPFFAGTFNAKDQDTVEFSPVDTPFSACLWKEIAHPDHLYRPTKGYEFLPRLLYWNKYSPTGLPSPATSFGLMKYAAVQTWFNEIRYLNPNADHSIFGDIISNIYPQATMINQESNLSPVLSYGNVWVRNYDDASGSSSPPEIGKGLYATYYQNMIEGLKRSPRLRTVYIALNITDIINLDFTRLIYIDGVYWRINKIVDYQPNKNESTKVELLEWFQIGVFAADAPMFGSSNTVWNPDGSVFDNDDIGL